MQVTGKAALSLLLFTCGTSYAHLPLKQPFALPEKAASTNGAPTIPVPIQTTPSTTPQNTKVAKPATPEKEVDKDNQPLADKIRAVAELKSFTAAYISAWIAGLMAVIAAIQAWFFWRQLRHMRNSNDTAAESAKAAKDSANAALLSVDLTKQQYIASHRPRISVRRAVNRSLSVNGESVLTVEYVIVNTGDTEARITTISEKVTCPRRAELRLEYAEPEKVDITVKPGQLARQFISTKAMGEAFGYWFECLKKPPESHIGPYKMIFFGYIEYVDLAGRTRRTAFLRNCDFETQRFFVVEHPDYEYQD
jgi:hypothetical protein